MPQAQTRKSKPKHRAAQADTLTLKQQRWIEFYMVSGNSTDAARKAGYKGSQNTLCQVGYQNLRKYELQARIAARVADSKVDANEVVGTLASQMRADITEILTPEGHLDIQLVRDKRLGHLIKKVKTRRYIENKGDESEREVELTEVELHNPQSAAIQLCKVLGIEKQPGTNPADDQARITAAIAQWRKATGGSEEEAILFLGEAGMSGVKDLGKIG